MDLHVRRGAEALGPFRLLDGPNVAGRSEDCDILLPSRRVSRHHCVFELFGGRVTVRDLGSHNGVVGSDGRRVSNLVLRPGDEVLIGDFMCGLQESEQTQTELELDVERSGPGEARGSARKPTEVRPLADLLDLNDAEMEDPDDLSIGAHLVTEEASSPFYKIADSPAALRAQERPAPTFAVPKPASDAAPRRPAPRPIAPLILDETSHPVVLRDQPTGLPIAFGASPLAVAPAVPAPPARALEGAAVPSPPVVVPVRLTPVATAAAPIPSAPPASAPTAPTPSAVRQFPAPNVAARKAAAPAAAAASAAPAAPAAPAPPAPVAPATRGVLPPAAPASLGSPLPLVVAGVLLVLIGLFVELWGAARVDQAAAALAADVSAEEALVLAGGSAFGVVVTSYDANGRAIGRGEALDADILQEAQERGIAHIEFAGGTRAVAVSRDAAGQVKGFVGVDGPPTRSKASATTFRALAATQAGVGLLIVVAAAFFSRRRS